MNNTKIILYDTFNDKRLSSHITVLAAVRAQRAHAREVERNNGKGAYVFYSFRYSDGAGVPDDEICAARQSLDCP